MRTPKVPTLGRNVTSNMRSFWEIQQQGGILGDRRKRKVFAAKGKRTKKYKQISYKQKSITMKVLQNEAIRLLQYYEALNMFKLLH